MSIKSRNLDTYLECVHSIDLRKAAEMALEYLEYLNELDIAGLDHEVHTNALRQALAQDEQEPVGNEVKLNIIRWWPDGFAERLDHVWKDLEGFIPNYKLHDLQLLLAEYGFTMKVYEGEAPSKPWQSLTDEERVQAFADAGLEIAYMDYDADMKISKVIEAKLKEKNT